jgi:NAD(P)H-dependent FMN reductase
MKKVIALSCSPSHGRNSDSMLDSFVEGASKNSNIEIEKVYLDDIKINYYKHENSKGAEFDEPEFAKLTEKIKQADGLIIATPTYNFAVPAHLKNFIDRIRFIALDLGRSDWLGQPKGLLNNLSCYFLVSGGTPHYAQKILFFAFPPFWLRGVFLYYGAKVFGAYYSDDTKTFENQKILAKCRREGQWYADRLVKGKGNRILEKIFWRPMQEE